MPEYYLDTNLDHDKWMSLNAFTRGYIECAFWTGDEESGILDMGFHDLAPAALECMISECKAFQDFAKDDLGLYCQVLSENNAGTDFWLTRNNHGAGFWDRGMGDLHTDTIGGRLSRDAKSFGSCDLYVGDNGRIYVS